MAADLPASLKPIKAYLEQAKQRAADPVIAYHCRLYALQEAMAMRASIPKADMGFILGLMDSLEKEKAAIGELEDAGVLCENFAQELFQKADDADRAGQSTLPVAKDFLSAAQLMEVCKQFGELPPDLLEKIKYGKWRFVEICKATKERRAPAPPKTLDPPPGAADGGGEGGEGSGDAPLPPLPGGDVGVPPVVPPAIPAPPYEGGGGAALPGAPYGDGGAGAPPAYLGLPPAPPPGVVPPAMPADPVPPSAAVHSPPSYSELPAAPALPNAPAPPPGAPPPYMAPMAPPPMGMLPAGGRYQPGRPQILEALKLSQGAVSALQFQDVDTAVNVLQQALHMLTQPPPPRAP